MKILCCFKGFTTNSSAASEWIPPDFPVQNSPGNKKESNSESTASDNTQSGTSSGDNTQSNSATQENAKTSTETNSAPRNETPSQTQENILVIAGFIMAILGIFLAERLIRKAIRTAKKHKS